MSVPQPCFPSLLLQDLTSLLFLLCLPTLCRSRGCLLADCAGFLGTKEVLYPLSSCSLSALTVSPVSGGRGSPWWWLLRLRDGYLCLAGLGTCCWCRQTPQCDCGNKGVSKAHPSTVCQQPESRCCHVCGSWCDGLGCGSCSPFSSVPRVVPAVLGLNRQSLLGSIIPAEQLMEAS